MKDLSDAVWVVWTAVYLAVLIAGVPWWLVVPTYFIVFLAWHWWYLTTSQVRATYIGSDDG